MSDATIQAAIQDLIQALDSFADAQVTLGDFRILGSGSPPYAVILPGSFEADRPGDWGQERFVWRHPVEVWDRFAGDDYSSAVTARQNVVDQLQKYPTLNGTAGVSLSTVTASSEPIFLWQRGAVRESMPQMVGFRLTVTTVEEAGWWSPATATDGGALPVHWYRADLGTFQAAGGAAATADGDVIGQWQDQATAADHLAQANNDKRPTLQTGANGQPVMRFDGADDYLQGPFTNGGLLAQPYTIFAVAQLDAASIDDGTADILLNADDNVQRMAFQAFLVGAPAEAYWRVYFGAFLAGGAADANWNIWTMLANGNTSQVWQNGVSEIGPGIGGAHTPDGLTVGAGYNGSSNWDGDVAEIIVYAGNLATDDKNQVGAYLASRYGLRYTSIK